MTSSRDGFSLVELLLALALGLMLVAVIGEALLGELGHSGRLARILRERSVSYRALELMRMELQEASAVHVMPGAIQRAGCALADRTVLLHLDFMPEAAQPGNEDVTYSLEPKPDGIWRGQTLMRCGPAYGLDGQMEEDSVAVSRVWLDGIAPNGVTLSRKGQDLVEVVLNRAFEQTDKTPHSMTFKASFAVPAFSE